MSGHRTCHLGRLLNGFGCQWARRFQSLQTDPLQLLGSTHHLRVRDQQVHLTSPHIAHPNHRRVRHHPSILSCVPVLDPLPIIVRARARLHFPPHFHQLRFFGHQLQLRVLGQQLCLFSRQLETHFVGLSLLERHESPQPFIFARPRPHSISGRNPLHPHSQPASLIVLWIIHRIQLRCGSGGRGREEFQLRIRVKPTWSVTGSESVVAFRGCVALDG
mmetsp:Transcript_47345/g.102809  ORF Transcript_47345/g.102809 Transcript_47345/m.102809 type:complete len:218 (+) Transcript_47345:233-886(+)